MPDLESPLENCLWAWCIMNSDACISLIVHPHFKIPGSASAVQLYSEENVHLII